MEKLEVKKLLREPDLVSMSFLLTPEWRGPCQTGEWLRVQTKTFRIKGAEAYILVCSLKLGKAAFSKPWLLM